jgi:hypothetical protein
VSAGSSLNLNDVHSQQEETRRERDSEREREGIFIYKKGIPGITCHMTTLTSSSEWMMITIDDPINQSVSQSMILMMKEYSLM